MKTLHTLLLGFLSLFIVSCAAPQSGSGTTRSLGHSYYDSRGMTMISLFDMGNAGRGVAMTMGSNKSSKDLVVSHEDFELLWTQLNEAELAPFAVRKGSQRFNVKENYVLIKGMMPGSHTTTYVVPKATAPAHVKNWVKSLRSKTNG